jgi:hypothetical protein
MLHANATRDTLGYARMVIAGIWGFVLLDRPNSDLAELPFSFFRPRGILCLIPEVVWPALTGPAGLATVRSTLIVLTVAAFAGLRPWRLLGPAWLAGLILYLGMYRGFGGHVNHRELALLYATVMLVVFPAADGLAVARPNKINTPSAVYPLAMLAICLSTLLPYVYIGLARVFTGGILGFQPGWMTYWAAYHSFLDSQWSFTLGQRALDWQWLRVLLAVAFPVSTVLEIMSPMALFSRLFRRIFIFGFVLPFHVGIALTMNILFVENCLLMLLFIDPAGRRCERTVPNTADA